MKKYLLTIFSLLFWVNSASAQSTNLSYSKVTKPLEPITSEIELENLAENKVRVAESYSDNLGRPMIDIVRRVTPDEHHLIQYHGYDYLGRETKVYLPYSSRMDSIIMEAANNSGVYPITPPTSNDPWTDHLSYFEDLQGTFYTGNQNFPNITPNSTPYSERVFEDSPKGRLLEQSAPGSAWRLDAHKTDRYTYRVNFHSEVWELEIAANTYDIIKKGIYTRSTLYVVEKRDADNRLTMNYTDLDGRLIMTAKLLDNNIISKTYYVYNKLGQLAYVLPPEAINDANSVSFGEEVTIPGPILDKWAFSYRYNGRGQLIEKKMPGIAPIYYIYDTKGRLVLVQDGKQREADKWNFIKYDQANRPIITGLYTNTIDRTWDDMQRHVNSQSSSFERRSNTNYASNFGYTNTTFPNISSNLEVEVLAINYYDDYDFNFDGNRDYSFVNDEFPGVEAFYRTRRMPTGSKSRILGGGATEWINAAVFYDDRGRVIQTFKDYGNSETERSIVKYDFEGKVLNTKSVHIRPALPNSIITNVTIRNRYEYDHAGRLVKLYKKMNTQPEVLLAQYEYNELSQLITKKVHSRDEKITPPANYEASFLQEINYKYNERGWLTKINDADLSNSQDLFGLELNYNAPGPLNAAAQYGGNIASMAWQSRSDDTRRNFAYSYDATGQLKSARYASGNQTLSAVDRYSLSGLTYDENGNIKSLRRRGYVQTGTPIGGGGDNSKLIQDPNAYYHIIDKLDYTYDGNKLLAVSDSVKNNNSSSRIDFKDGSTQSNEYAYDANGNMREDKNKNISSIEYNALNLPQKITFASGNVMQFKYDASGKKLYQEMVSGGARVNWTSYRSWNTFENDSSGIIQTEEGRLITGNRNYWDFEYHYADHLGNVRVTYGEKKEITELKLTLEAQTIQDEKNQFLNVSEIDPNRDNTRAHTGTYSILVNSLNGPKIKTPLQVKSGDRVQASVWYFHQNPPSGGGQQSRLQQPKFNNSITRLSKPSIALGVSLIPLGSHGNNASNIGPAEKPGSYIPAVQLNVVGGLTYLWAASKGQAGMNTRQSQTQPMGDENPAGLFIENEPINPPTRAYLVWEIWKSDETTILSQGRAQVQYIANGNWQELKLNLEIDLKAFDDTEGKLIVKLENLDGTNVWFDDLVIKHTRRDQPEIVQADHYDPFGLMIQDLSYRKPNELINKNLYNAGSEWQKDLQWYSTFYRQYDPQLGRFQQFDPAAEAEYAFSPYNYTGNNPIIFNDPLGDIRVNQHVSTGSFWNWLKGVFSGDDGGGSSGGGGSSTFSDFGALLHAIATNFNNVAQGTYTQGDGGLNFQSIVDNGTGQYGHWEERLEMGRIIGAKTGKIYGYEWRNRTVWVPFKAPVIDWGSTQLTNSNQNGYLDWMMEHFDVAAGYSLSFGAQLGGGISKGVAAYGNLYSTVHSDLEVSNKGGIQGGKYKPSEKVNWGFGGAYHGGIDYKGQLYQGRVEHELSIGGYGFGVTMKFDESNQMIDWFIGFEPTVIMQFGIGLEVNFRIGFSK